MVKLSPSSRLGRQPATTRALGRRARRRAETREGIVRAALKLFARQGFFATTVEQITQAADVGKGTFFNYFPSKEHVLTGFGEFQLAKIRAALEEARQRAAPMRVVTRRLLLALAAMPGESPELVRSFLLVILSSGSARPLILQKLGQGRRLLGELVAVGQRRGEIRADLERTAVAGHLQQMFFGGLLLWTLHPVTKLTQWIEPTFEAFWRSVSAPGKGNSR
jgi:AcrR family transcriptional regulator